ncbi:MAG: hypothetical protein WCT39_03770 [Candidatus Margulisiibacteriota bacterium]
MQIERDVACRIKKLQGQDNRLRFGHEFPKPLTQKESESLLDHLDQLVVTIRDVEQIFWARFNIPERFQQIEILLPGSFNQALCGLYPPTIKYLLGASGEYQDFFAGAKATFAHEMGHLVSAVLPDGTFRYVDDSVANHATTDVEYLKTSGPVPYKYLKGVDFSLFPIPLIENDHGPEGLHYQLNELIANRVAEIILGETITTNRIQAQIQKYLQSASNKPFVSLFLQVMADITLSSLGEDLLSNELCGIKLPWEDQISTQELRAKMADFYKKIVIISNKPATIEVSAQLGLRSSFIRF